MANGISTVDYTKYLNPEELKHIRRGKIADFLIGGSRGSERTSQYMPIGFARAGQKAIKSIESGLNTPEGEMAQYDLSGIGKKLSGASPEELERFKSSGPLQEHIRDLEGMKPSYEDLKRENITEKGLGFLPQVKEYTSGKEAEFKQQKEETRLQGLQEGMSKIAEMIQGDNPVAAEYLRTTAMAKNEKEIAETMKQVLDDIEAKREGGRATELETHKSKLEMGEMAKKHGYDVDLEGEKQEGRIDLEKLRQSGDRALQELKNTTKKASSVNDRFSDVENAFDQLKTQHGKIWTGPVAGLVGRANITSENRAGFNATRAFLLKTIGRAFEPRLSNMDMKFYERMIPKDMATDKQFDAAQTSIMNLVKWRLQRLEETGKDPGPVPSDKKELETKTPMMPKKGTIEDGYEFLGGDPSDPNSWRKK